jgi:hypothetical protein
MTDRYLQNDEAVQIVVGVNLVVPRRPTATA